MKLIIDIPEEDYKTIIQRPKQCVVHWDIVDALRDGTPLDSVIEEYVERGAITENMRMLDKIDSIKAEIEQGTSHFAFERGDVAYGLEIALHIINKHLADMRGKSCNTCKNNDDEFSGECYECVKNIQNHYKAESEEV